MRIACLLALAFALGAAPARADDAAMHAAKRHYESGEKLFGVRHCGLLPLVKFKTSLAL